MNARVQKIGKPGFDAFVLAAVVAEMRPLLVGARVQKIQQPTATDVTLMLYGKVGAQKLLFSADPRAFRVLLTRTRQENPLNPLGFCQVCRKYLDGAALDSIEMPHFDRIVHFQFRASDGERITLTAELMGRNANLFLVSGGGIVRGVLRPIPADSERVLRPNVPYTPPPQTRQLRDPLTEDEAAPSDAPDQEMDRWLMETFSGIGPFAAREIAARATTAGTVAAVLNAFMTDVRAERFDPHVVYDAVGKVAGAWAFNPQATVPHTRPVPSIGAVLDSFYADDGPAAGPSEARELGRSVDREIKWREKELDSAQATLAEAARADAYEQVGNNLLAALPRFEATARGLISVTVPDLYSANGATAEVALDGSLTLRENADRYFLRAHKARDAQAYAEERQTILKLQLRDLNRIARQLSDTMEAAALAGIKKDFARIVGEERAMPGSPAVKVKAPEKPFEGHRIRTFNLDGFTLLVGETAEANDYLTTKVAAPLDLWMHVRGASGAHGVLRTEKQPQRVPDSVIRKAAAVVAARSGTVKHAGIVAVDVTEKRYVRKPRSAKPGQVIIERERTLDVTPQLPD